MYSLSTLQDMFERPPPTDAAPIAQPSRPGGDRDAQAYAYTYTWCRTRTRTPTPTPASPTISTYTQTQAHANVHAHAQTCHPGRTPLPLHVHAILPTSTSAVRARSAWAAHGPEATFYRPAAGWYTAQQRRNGQEWLCPRSTSCWLACLVAPSFAAVARWALLAVGRELFLQNVVRLYSRG